MSKHFDIEHNSSDWYFARAGIATASAFDRIITKSGKPSAQADDYANLLVAELLLGRAIERNFSTFSMEWGHLHEEDARKLYQFETGFELQKGGFFTDDAVSIGASPDVRVFRDGKLVGIAEIKCPENPANHIEFLLMQEMNPKYVPQVQGQWFVATEGGGNPDLEFIDWFSYYPEMPSARVRIYPDSNFQVQLKHALEDFKELVDKKIARLIELGHLDEAPIKVMPGAEKEPIDWKIT